MPATYEPIATTTLGSATNAITFSSIPSTYTDLRAVLCINGASGGNLNLRYNSLTENSYSGTYLRGIGTTAESGRQAIDNAFFISYGGAGSVPTTVPSLFTVDIFSYGSINQYRTSLSTTQTDQNGSGRVSTAVWLWQNNNAINTVSFFMSSSNTFSSGTTLTLYGIKAA